jgi:hypothetical protein
MVESLKSSVLCEFLVLDFIFSDNLELITMEVNWNPELFYVDPLCLK